MTPAIDKVVRVERILIGTRPLRITLPVGNSHSLEEFLLDNHETIFPGFRHKTPQRLFHSWNNLTSDNVSLFEHTLKYYYVYGDTNVKASIHLVDEVLADHLRIFDSGTKFNHNDAISFFLQENFGRDLEFLDHASATNNGQRDALWVMERLLSQTGSYILLDNFSEYRARTDTGEFLSHCVPSVVWRMLESATLSYYQRFMISFAHKIILLNHCLDRTTDSRISRGNKEEWLHRCLFRLGFDILILLSIPEAFLRTFRPHVFNYADGLQEVGIPRSPHKDPVQYASRIAGESITRISNSLLQSMSVIEYDDFIRFCANTPVSHPAISEFLHTFRVIFNGIKHATGIEVIQTRDAETERVAALKALDQELAALESSSHASIRDIESKKLELTVKREVIEKVRHVHETLNLHDPQFSKNNGIRIRNGQAGYFDVTLDDLERSLKMIIGLLTVLIRCGPSS